jgi:hypothetical protein
MSEQTTLVRSGALLQKRIEKTLQRIKDIKTQMALLQKQGLIYATPYWRAGEGHGESSDYLYLLHSMRKTTNATGGRVREYIGNKQKKIDAAMAGIDRGKQYDVLSHELERRIACIQKAAELIDGALVYLR